MEVSKVLSLSLSQTWPPTTATPFSCSGLAIARLTIPFGVLTSLTLSTRHSPVARRCKTKKQEALVEGLPKEYYDDEWQARQREKTRELERLRKEEDDEDERKISQYREIGLRLKGFPEEDVLNAKKLVSSFLKAEEEVEEKIEQAAEKGELTELVLMVIWNRLDLARRDEERDVIRSLDLLYRRIETEILKQEASPAMRLLNDLLNLHDGVNNNEWLKECKKRMAETFPREDPFSILVPAGYDINKHEGQILPPLEDDDDILFRGEFIREVAEFLEEVRAQQSKTADAQGFDPESIANRMKQQEKEQAINQVKALLQLAVNLQW